MAIPSASCWAGIRVIAASLFVLTSVVPAMAQQGSANLPLKRVVLFSSGVGFFDHDGQVEGNADVQMKFNVRDINDLLKSMVVEDLGGGQISTVTYGSKDPITKTLKSFAIDLTTNPTLFDLLQQVRGERIELDVGMPDKITGVILGLEKRKDRVGEKEVVESQVVNLLTDKGLRSVELNTVSSIKLLNDKLDGELRKALTLLATSHDTDKKTVTLNFLGEKKRRVRVGYIQESPVWKTSYRLVLEDGKSPFLQGWAIVENTTEEDWSGVNLTLVSGRPISFTMDLYQPLYVPRPAEQLELYSSLRPQVYGQDLARREAEFLDRAAATLAAAKSPMRLAADQPKGLAGAYSGGKQRFSVGVESDVGTLGSVLAEKQSEPNWQLRQGGQSAAAARDVGSLFQYAIRTPVNLPRQQSAMLPIVNGEIKGEKVSIYNQAVQAKHPLNGLKMTNTTDLHLMQGPITVLDDGVYAGDAKIDDLPPGSERLISYAMDLDTEVAPAVKHRPSQILKVRLLKGVMHVDNKYARATEYTVKNSGRKAEKVLIESPLESEWKLVTPKEPAEKTRDKYRFAVEAKPGQPAKLLVEEERTERQQIALSNLDDNMVLLYRNAREVSDRVKAALAEVVKQRQAIQQVAEKREQLEARIRAIGEDQARIRQNMVQLDRTSEIYKTYVKKFSDQEAEIERLRTQIAELQAQENQLRKALDDYLIGLDLD
jgi:hypothetical protein